MTSTFATAVGRGRHRRGRPGLVPVASFVTVVYRSLFVSWRLPGKHRPRISPRHRTAVAPSPAPAV